MRRFQKSNPFLDRTMKTHIIDLDKFGVWDNDFETFFWNRCHTISRRLRRRVIREPIDGRGQEVYTDAFEDPELEQDVG